MTTNWKHLTSEVIDESWEFRKNFKNVAENIPKIFKSLQKKLQDVKKINKVSTPQTELK